MIDSGKFDFARFPTIADPSPSYHGLRFFDTFGHYGFLMKLRTETVRDTGACISPAEQLPPIQGLETLSLRMERHVSNAAGVAKFLAEHPKVERVNLRRPAGQSVSRPGLQVSPQGTRRRLFLRPQAARRRCPRGGQAVHRIAAALLAPGQRRRRPQPGDPSGVDHPPTA